MDVIKTEFFKSRESQTFPWLHYIVTIYVSHGLKKKKSLLTPIQNLHIKPPTVSLIF